MDLVEYHTVENRVKFNNEEAFTDGIDEPNDWLWICQNNCWHPIINLPETKYCQCIGACCKAILYDGIICEDETFNLDKK